MKTHTIINFLGFFMCLFACSSDAAPPSWSEIPKISGKVKFAVWVDRVTTTLVEEDENSSGGFYERKFHSGPKWFLVIEDYSGIPETNADQISLASVYGSKIMIGPFANMYDYLTKKEKHYLFIPINGPKEWRFKSGQLIELSDLVYTITADDSDMSAIQIGLNGLMIDEKKLESQQQWKLDSNGYPVSKNAVQ